MSVNISKALGIGMALLLVTISISFSLSSVFEVNGFLNQVVVLKEERNRNITQQTQIPNDVPVQGSEVLHYLYRIQELGVDIQVDSSFFEKTTDRHEIDFQSINVEQVYELSIIRNTNGDTIALHFHSQ
jgi:hypothetical protein